MKQNEKIFIKSNLAIHNVIKLSVYGEKTHDIISQHQFAISDEYSLDQVNQLIDSLYEGNNDLLLSDPDYICPIIEMEDILCNLDTFTKEELVVITFASSIKGQEVILYDPNSKQLKAREVDDLKHIIYEEYKLYLSCSNLIFRFETIKADYFYIKLNSAHADIMVEVLDSNRGFVEFTFSTLIKEDREYEFDEVDFITTIDSTRSPMLTISDARLVSFNGVDTLEQGKKPVRFSFQGYLLNDLGTFNE